MIRKNLLLTLIIFGCIASGFFFFKFNGGDRINAVFFAIGLSGIALSFLRDKKNE